MKKTIYLTILLVFLVSTSLADFTYQDNTYRTSIRLCDNTSCENLEDGNTSRCYPSEAYEIRHDRVEEFDFWDTIQNNPSLVITLMLSLIILAISFGVFKYGRQKTK